MEETDEPVDYRAAITIRGREVAFMRSDLDALGEELVKEFPDLRFVDELTREQEKASDRPEVPIYRHISQCADDQLITFIFNPKELPPPERCEDSRDWIQPLSFPYAHIRFWPAPDRRGIGPHAVPIHVWLNDLVFVAQKNNASDMDIITRAARRPARVSYKGAMQFFFLETQEGAPAKETARKITRKPSIAFGRDAVSWARESPDRVLGLYMPGPAWAYAYRPVD